MSALRILIGVLAAATITQIAVVRANAQENIDAYACQYIGTSTLVHRHRQKIQVLRSSWKLAAPSPWRSAVLAAISSQTRLNLLTESVH